MNGAWTDTGRSCRMALIGFGSIDGGANVARVVGIHGIGQQYSGGPKLTQEWWLAVRGGLESAGYRAAADQLAETDVRVAYFGDLFRPSGAMGTGDPPYTAADIEPGLERDLLAALYGQAVADDNTLGAPPGAMAGAPISVQVMLDRLLHSPTFANVARRAFIGNLKQVIAFLNDAQTKAVALQRLAAEISPDTRVVIGHSLGSVVAYEYLARPFSTEIPLLVTIGSPLGIRNLVFERLTPPPTAGAGLWPAVRTWVNVADTDDLVALRKKLSGLFPRANGRPGIYDSNVDNGRQPHSAFNYLNAAVIGSAIGVELRSS